MAVIIQLVRYVNVAVGYFCVARVDRILVHLVNRDRAVRCVRISLFNIVGCVCQLEAELAGSQVAPVQHLLRLKAGAVLRAVLVREYSSLYQRTAGICYQISIGIL